MSLPPKLKELAREAGNGIARMIKKMPRENMVGYINKHGGLYQYGLFDVEEKTDLEIRAVVFTIMMEACDIPLLEE